MESFWSKLLLSPPAGTRKKKKKKKKVFHARPSGFMESGVRGFIFMLLGQAVGEKKEEKGCPKACTLNGPPLR